MTILRLFLLLLLVASAAACGNEPATTPDGASENSGAMQGAPPAASDAALPVVEDGVQVVQIEAGPSGYSPGTIQLRPGVPARLVFTRTTESACLEQVRIPDFGVERTDLPLDEPVSIEFTPDEGGEFQFVCGMDMQKGTIVVRS